MEPVTTEKTAVVGSPHQETDDLPTMLPEKALAQLRENGFPSFSPSEVEREQLQVWDEVHAEYVDRTSPLDPPLLFGPSKRPERCSMAAVAYASSPCASLPPSKARFQGQEVNVDGGSIPISDQYFPMIIEGRRQFAIDVASVVAHIADDVPHDLATHILVSPPSPDISEEEFGFREFTPQEEEWQEVDPLICALALLEFIWRRGHPEYKVSRFAWAYMTDPQNGRTFQLTGLKHLKHIMSRVVGADLWSQIQSQAGIPSENHFTLSEIIPSFSRS